MKFWESHECTPYNKHTAPLLHPNLVPEKKWAKIKIVFPSEIRNSRNIMKSKGVKPKMRGPKLGSGVN
jgi:hypothetical protein